MGTQDVAGRIKPCLSLQRDLKEHEELGMLVPSLWEVVEEGSGVQGHPLSSAT